VTAASGAHHPTGNYELSALFGTQTAPLAPLTGGRLSAGHADEYRFFVGRTQLFQFNLSASSVGGSTGSVRMELRDAAGRLVLSLTAQAGQTITSTSLFLMPGSYSVRFVLLPGATGTLAYGLAGVVLSDNIGPVLTDPTLSTQFISPTDPNLFLYPGNVTTGSTYFWVLIDPHGTLLLPGGKHGTIVHGFPVVGGKVVHHKKH
jgi:hypothetical protein